MVWSSLLLLVVVLCYSAHGQFYQMTVYSGAELHVLLDLIEVKQLERVEISLGNDIVFPVDLNYRHQLSRQVTIDGGGHIVHLNYGGFSVVSASSKTPLTLQNIVYNIDNIFEVSNGLHESPSCLQMKDLDSESLSNIISELNLFPDPSQVLLEQQLDFFIGCTRQQSEENQVNLALNISAPGAHLDNIGVQSQLVLGDGTVQLNSTINLATTNDGNFSINSKIVLSNGQLIDHSMQDPVQVKVPMQLCFNKQIQHACDLSDEPLLLSKENYTDFHDSSLIKLQFPASAMMYKLHLKSEVSVPTVTRFGCESGSQCTRNDFGSPFKASRHGKLCQQQLCSSKIHVNCQVLDEIEHYFNTLPKTCSGDLQTCPYVRFKRITDDESHQLNIEYARYEGVCILHSAIRCMERDTTIHQVPPDLEGLVDFDDLKEPVTPNEIVSWGRSAHGRNFSINLGDSNTDMMQYSSRGRRGLPTWAIGLVAALAAIVFSLFCVLCCVAVTCWQHSGKGMHRRDKTLPRYCDSLPQGGARASPVDQRGEWVSIGSPQHLPAALVRPVVQSNGHKHGFEPLMYNGEAGKGVLQGLQHGGEVRRLGEVSPSYSVGMGSSVGKGKGLRGDMSTSAASVNSSRRHLEMQAFNEVHSESVSQRSRASLSALSKSNAGEGASRSAGVQSGAGSGDIGQEYVRTIQGMMDDIKQAGKLELTAQIGRGAHGVVYKGYYHSEPVAVKVMILTGDAEQKRQHHAMIEAAITCTFQHAHIVQSKGFSIEKMKEDETKEAFMKKLRSLAPTEYQVYKLSLVQEYCDMGTLTDHMRTARFYDQSTAAPVLKTVLTVAVHIARGLAHLHNNNIVHGDLKSTNVLLQSSDNKLGFIAKIADFGLSVRLADAQQEVNHFFAGTPYYVAPEVQKEGKLSKSADVWGLGVLLWELFNGQLIYQSRHQASSAGDSQTHPVQTFPYFPVTCPLAYALLCCLCLSLQPSGRPTVDTILELLNCMVEAESEGILRVGKCNEADNRAFLQDTDAVHSNHIINKIKQLCAKQSSTTPPPTDHPPPTHQSPPHNTPPTPKAPLSIPPTQVHSPPSESPRHTYLTPQPHILPDHPPPPTHTPTQPPSAKPPQPRSMEEALRGSTEQVLPIQQRAQSLPLQQISEQLNGQTWTWMTAQFKYRNGLQAGRGGGMVCREQEGQSMARVSNSTSRSSASGTKG